MAPGKSKEAEIKRINKELANIRSKFKGDKALDGYSKKKYVCKLLFIFLLGHDIDFGHMEAVNLLSSNKYTEKQIVSQAASRLDQPRKEQRAQKFVGKRNLSQNCCKQCDVNVTMVQSVSRLVC